MADGPQAGHVHALADRLQQRLDALGLTQSDLARRSDVSLSYVSRLVRAQIRNPTIDVVRKLADALELSLDELAGPASLPVDQATHMSQPRSSLIWLLAMVTAATSSLSLMAT